MEVEGRKIDVSKIPVIHGKDLIKQKKEPNLLQKILTCVGKGLTTGKWEWNVTIKF